MGARPALGGQRWQRKAPPNTTEAVLKLVDIMRNGDTSQSQGMAADKLLDRGWGKPNQPVEVNAGQSVIDYLAGLSRRDIPDPVVPEPAIVRH